MNQISLARLNLGNRADRHLAKISKGEEIKVYTVTKSGKAKEKENKLEVAKGRSKVYTKIKSVKKDIEKMTLILATHTQPDRSRGDGWFMMDDGIGVSTAYIPSCINKLTELSKTLKEQENYKNKYKVLTVLRETKVLTDTDCSVCLEKIITGKSGMIMRCGHTYHLKCLNDWIITGNPTCPMCRQ